MAEEIHVRDYLAVIRKHDFIVIACFLLVFGPAFIVSLHIPREYEATATVEVKSGSEKTGLSSLMQSFISRGADQVSLETICKRFVSRTILSETMQNLKKRYSNLDFGSSEALEHKIRTKVVPDTRMIEVTVRMRRDEGGSQKATIIANELVSVMQNHLSQKTNAELEKRYRFLDEKMKTVETQIGNSDRDIQNFLRDSGDDMVWSAKAEYLLARLSKLIELKEQAETLLSAEKQKLSDLKTKLKTEPEWIEYSRTLSLDSLWDKSRVDLSELEKELAAAKTEFGEKSSKVKTIEAQINKVREDMTNMAKDIMSARTESRNPTYQTILDQIIESELNSIAYRAQLDTAERMLNTLSSERDRMFTELPQSKFQLDKMRRQIDYELDIYKLLLEKKLEADIWANESVDSEFGSMKGGL
ncbi:hypothetical protein FJZ33_08975, partial [Candidatus Poribacteria bacterium]|nr:hypothetical protein [Candidatus Poribacteria bacterium]